MWMIHFDWFFEKVYQRVIYRRRKLNLKNCPWKNYEVGKALDLLLSSLPVLLSTGQLPGMTTIPDLVPRPWAACACTWNSQWSVLRRESILPPAFLMFSERPHENSILI